MTMTRVFGIPIFMAKDIDRVPGFTAEEIRRFRETQKRAEEAISHKSKIDYKEIFAPRYARPKQLSITEIYAARNKPQSRSR